LVNTATANNQDGPQITALSNGGFVVTWVDDSRGVGGASGDASSIAVKAQVFAADGTRVGSELLVNTATADVQDQQQITALSNGGFVVTWRDASAGIGGATGDTASSAIKAQVFAADGSRVGSELLVNSATASVQAFPQITALSNGGFVVTWVDDSRGVGGASGDASNIAVKAQVFAADGARVGTELLVNTATAGGQSVPQITALPNGGFVVTWTDFSLGNGGATGDNAGSAIKAQVFNTGLDAVEQVALSLKNRGFSVTDPDAGDVLSVTLSVTYGAINVTAGTSGATVASGNGTASVVISGTASQITALLNSNATSTVTYTADTDTPPATATVTLSANDGAGGTATTTATITIVDTFDAPAVGTANADTLSGTTGADTIDGLGGDDILSGRAGNDILNGNTGNDTASYASAAAGVTARLNLGTASNDGDGGSDTFVSIENLTGSAFIDLLVGNGIANVLNGGLGADTLLGLGGNDILIGGTGANNTLQGGLGDDLYVVDANDTVIELSGEGTDTVQTSRTTYLLRTHVENLQYTGSAAFRGTGNAADNTIEGGSGNDVLIGRGGNDRLDGNGGTDTADYSAAAGAVTASLLAGAASNDGDGGTDVLGEIENLTGSAFADSLTGSAGANVLNGGSGHDVLAGRGGNDVLNGGAGTDTADYSGAAGGVDLKLALNTATNDGDGGSDTFISIENITGSAFNDTLSGDGLANVINGGLGADFLQGLGGNDTLIGGAGTANQLQGGLGDDTYVVDANDTIVEFSGEGTDTVQTSRNFQPLAANVENLTFTGTGNFTGIGNALANVITGGAGNDSLTGGLGNDTLNGGAGTADMMVVQGLVGSYTVTDLGGGSYRIVDAVGGRDGTDTTTGVELIRFSNGATVALASLVPPPAPLQPVDKTAGGPQVLPGLSDDDFLPLAKDGDLPLVLPGAEDPFADLFLGPDQMSLDQGSGSPWQMLSLDQDGTLDQAFDGIVGALDRSGWNHDTWSF
jgi:Ca2+-binding RTX toxin-like protein